MEIDARGIQLEHSARHMFVCVCFVAFSIKSPFLSLSLTLHGTEHEWSLCVNVSSQMPLNNAESDQLII